MNIARRRYNLRRAGASIYGFELFGENITTYHHSTAIASFHPFDRIIVSQAVTENLTLLSKDRGLKKYKIKQQWV